MPSGQNRTIVPVRPGGAGPDVAEPLVGSATVDVGHPVAPTVPIDLDLDAAGQGVDHRDADAVESAGHLVAAAAELAAGVEDGENDLGRGEVVVLGMRLDGDSATVVA